jgi:hypothetical protein
MYQNVTHNDTLYILFLHNGKTPFNFTQSLQRQSTNTPLFLFLPPKPLREVGLFVDVCIVRGLMLLKYERNFKSLS